METNTDGNIAGSIPPNAVSVYGQTADAMDEFPVLKAFQQYIDAEQAKARKRLISLGIFFAILTGAVIAAAARLPQPVAFVLWGGQAQEMYRAAACGHPSAETAPAAGPRLILESAHPSPLSAYRGFFGSRPFSKITAFLTARGQAPIDWCGRE